MLQQTDYNPNVPIYLQIMSKIRVKIVSGQWKEGDRVPSVRELSAVFGVNPNTMQRALTELEREQLLYSERTSGRFVTKDTARIAQAREMFGKEIIGRLLEELTALGYTKEQIAQLVMEG